MDAEFSQSTGSLKANRLVLTVGKFSVVDIFDANKYANSPNSDFLSWSTVNAGSFDYAGDAWAYSYGAAATDVHGLATCKAPFSGGPTLSRSIIRRPSDAQS